jgi:hypothetical protein
MLKRLKHRLGRHLRNSQRGQSIVLLALGFIALAAFVGLVTDVSIMFVRVSTLRRAVDAAAVAAAGQIREGTDYGTMALAARQYSVLHGLEPHRVWVETCETDIAEWREDNPESGDPPDTTISDVMPPTDLCDWDNPRKLVRVVGQIDSETTFLKLIGIENFVITASATSETAALDVALVLDNSGSMAKLTTSAHFTSRGMDIIADPPLVPDGSNDVLATCVRQVVTNPTSAENYDWGGCCTDPGAGAFVYQDPADGEWKIYTDVDSAWLEGSPPVTVTSGGNGQYDAGELGIEFNYPDNNYSDLVCEPFKQVKDAARNFIQRLDFIRGDRVSIVTFNRNADVIFPNNDSSQPPMITSEEDAIRTLDTFVGVFENPVGKRSGCLADDRAAEDVANKEGEAVTSVDLDNNLRPRSYESIAQCTETNIGDGIRRANEALTNVDTIRRDAVWVAIILSDGAANASLSLAPDKVVNGMQAGEQAFYGDFGFCPWYTFCYARDPSDPLHGWAWKDFPDDATGDGLIQHTEIVNFWYNEEPWVSHPSSPDTFPRASYDECLTSRSGVPQSIIDSSDWCNDGDSKTRHFCLEWDNDPNLNGIPSGDPECNEAGRYDADDYARDMADWAGLIRLAPNIPGNFIAMFSIGFGEMAGTSTAAPLLRYIADAGDNGVIDRNLEQDWREHKTALFYGPNGDQNGGYPSSYGPEDPCYGQEYDDDPTKWCGQYYYANTLAELDAVFEAIAGRLFTRIAR